MGTSERPGPVPRHGALPRTAGTPDGGWLVLTAGPEVARLSHGPATPALATRSSAALGVPGWRNPPQTVCCAEQQGRWFAPEEPSLSVCPWDVCPFPRDAALPTPRWSPPHFHARGRFGVSPGHGGAGLPPCSPTERLCRRGSSAGSCVGRICHSPFALAFFFFSIPILKRNPSAAALRFSPLPSRAAQAGGCGSVPPGKPGNPPSPRSALIKALEG